jgi:hypothetical protein
MHFPFVVRVWNDGVQAQPALPGIAAAARFVASKRLDFRPRWAAVVAAKEARGINTSEDRVRIAGVCWINVPDTFYGNPGIIGVPRAVFGALPLASAVVAALNIRTKTFGVSRGIQRFAVARIESEMMDHQSLE